MHTALHPRYDDDTLYVSRKGRRGIARIEDSVDSSMRRLEDYKKVQRKTAYNEQKQYGKYEDHKNKINLETRMGRKITV